LTVPVGNAEADAEAGELEVAAELDELLLLLLLHPAASAVQAMASRATRGARFLARRGVIPRTLPLILARRKEYGHPVSSQLSFISPNDTSACGKPPWHPRRPPGIVDG
jgi:hypothetical protein